MILRHGYTSLQIYLSDFFCQPKTNFYWVKSSKRINKLESQTVTLVVMLVVEGWLNEHKKQVA